MKNFDTELMRQVKYEEFLLNSTLSLKITQAVANQIDHEIEQEMFSKFLSRQEEVKNN